MAFPLFLITVFVAYFLWAVIVSDSFYHRVNSLALLSLIASAFALLWFWPSASSTLLLPVFIADFLLCVALSPVQKLFFHAAQDPPALESIQEFSSPGNAFLAE